MGMVIQHIGNRISRRRAFFTGRWQRWVFSSALVLLPACARCSSSVRAAADAGSTTAQAPQKAASDARSSAVTPSWAELLAAGRYREASLKLDQLPEAEREKPKLRFVRADVAHRLGRDAQAVLLLDKLDEKLPILAPEIEKLRAEARLHTDELTLGADWLAQHGQPEAWLTAAKSAHGDGQSEQAIKCVDRALSLLSGASGSSARNQVAEAHALRGTLLAEAGKSDQATLEWQWLVLRAPEQPAAHEAWQQLKKAAPSTLTAEQCTERAKILAENGQVTAAEAELDMAVQAPGARPSPALRAFLRGRARSTARIEHAEGAKWLMRAVELGVGDADLVRLEAARLYVRAGADDKALEIYHQLAKRSGSVGENATYLGARLQWASGKYRKAIMGYDRLLRRFPKTRRSKTAAYERAVARIGAEEGDKARGELDALARAETRESLRSRYEELAALASLVGGHRDDAIDRFRKVVERYPLTLPGLCARARLRRLGQTVLAAPATDAAPSSPIADFELPPKTALLKSLKMMDLAAESLRSDEPAIRQRYGPRAARALCQAGVEVERAERSYALSHSFFGDLDRSRAPDQDHRWCWDCRYPRPYPAMLDEFEQRRGLPRHLTVSVMRQESAFRPEVVSPAGAVGLMQIMPSTAARLANETGLEKPQPLDDPRVNISLGTLYLKKLLDAFDQNLVLAVCAYNAGPQMTAHWLEGPPAPLDLFVARIPFAQTRGYVHHVLANLATYTYLEGGVAKLPQLGLSLPSGPLTPPSALY